MPFEYTIKTSYRARNLRITIHRDSRVVVVAPLNFSHSKVHHFVRLKADWIIKHVHKIKNLGERIALPNGKKSYAQYKARARAFVHHQVKELNTIYNHSYHRIAIKNHSTRWGSCSKKRNLNFNYRIIFLPVHLAQYVIVHELCHLKEMNHSKKFWDLVAHAVPDFKTRRKQLKTLAM